LIKLTRPPKPAYLTLEREAELLDRFKADGSTVWKNQQITGPLLQASNSKCAYCECGLQEVDSYMEVEHFKHKGEYEDDVIQWENLLPSCKRCNTNKGTHDVVVEPIVEPFNMIPNDHLRLDTVYIRYKSIVGQTTIEVLDLNSIDRLVTPRFDITIQIEKNVLAIQSAMDLFIQDRTVRRRNRLIGVLKGTLKECQRDTKFSATAATFLHRNEQYNALCAEIRAENLWDDELEHLHQESGLIRLDQ
jgi:hypothetical protein